MATMLAILMVVTISTIAVNLAFAADPDLLQDFCVADLTSDLTINGFPCKKEFTVDDFTTTAIKFPGDTNNIYGTKVTEANVKRFPGINTQGISMSRVDFAPGGINPPHSHPRASEIQYYVKGEVLIGLITTSGQLISKIVKQGEAVVFPKGLVHFQKNIGTEPAMALVNFNSQFPGVQFIALSLFNSTPSIPDDILSQTFQLDIEQIRNVKSRLSTQSFKYYYL